MNAKYKGKTPVKARDSIDLLIGDDYWHRTRVIDALASQFTAKVKGTVRFYFYAEQGLTWRKAKND